MEEIDKKDEELVIEAKRVAIKFSKEMYFSDIKNENRRITTVAAALRTENGNIFSGPNIFHPCANPCSMDAEYTAIAKAYSEGNRNIDSIVAYWYKDEDNQKILMPCGQCRELMKLFGNPWIIFESGGNIKKEKLNNLLP